MVRCISIAFTYFLILNSSFVSPKRLRKRIIGGYDASIGQFPYIASIRTYNSMRNFCGGTIVSERHIVSAAHCVEHLLSKPDDIFVVVGARDRKIDGHHMRIERIYSHSEFNATTLVHDISVLKTTHSIMFSEYVRPIALPTPEVRTSSDMKSVIIGWGQTVCVPFFKIMKSKEEFTIAGTEKRCKDPSIPKYNHH